MTKKLENKKLLLVDDNKINRQLILAFLKEYNVIITDCTNGNDAIEILKKEKFDIILTDIQMPEMSGVELIQIIKKELKIETPIIIISAEDRINIENVDFLRIPIFKNDLVKIIIKNIKK